MWHVALIYDATNAYNLKVMAGVAEYLHEKGNYNVYIEANALKDQRLPNLGSWDGDGIIANFDHPKVAKAVIRAKLPAVAFGSGYGWYTRTSHIPYFSTNQPMVARLAADHLFERGLRNFAYCGYMRTAINGWSEERERAFVNSLGERGFCCHIYHARHKTARHWTSLQQSLASWLLSLPRPVGVLAANDDRAHHILEACRTAQLRVPADVAVIGVDNDELLCQLTSPSLSSIQQAARRMGYEAAACLERLMSGKRRRKQRTVFDPMGLVARQSTDMVTIDDPAVARAAKYIQQNACIGINVSKVVSEAAISRSGLQTRFRTKMGCTIHEAIRRVQLHEAQRLLADTKIPIKQIATNVGFRSVQYMTRIFGDAFHQTPARYRRAI